MPFATDANGWFNKAFYASVFFENSNTKAQVTGNFDGTGLTCGFLGWTFLYGDQQKLVRQFMNQFPGEIQKLMPATWKEYSDACMMTPNIGTDHVAKWSEGSVVHNPYRNELQAFWNSPDMIQIQIEKAKLDMAPFADQWTAAFCKWFNVPANLNMYSLFFDVRVMNGSMRDINCSLIPKDRGSLMSSMTANLKWAASQTSGAMHDDMRKNANLWGMFVQKSDDWRLGLFQIAYLRSQLCRSQYISACLCRKGALVFGSGWVNGELYTL